MFKAIKEFFFGKPQAAQPEVPYKVEAPVVVSTVSVDASLDNKPQVIAVAVEYAPAVKKSSAPRAKKPAVAKPAAKPAAAKKPAAPRKPKTPAA